MLLRQTETVNTIVQWPLYLEESKAAISEPWNIKRGTANVIKMSQFNTSDCQLFSSNQQLMKIAHVYIVQRVVHTCSHTRIGVKLFRKLTYWNIWFASMYLWFIYHSNIYHFVWLGCCVSPRATNSMRTYFYQSLAIANKQIYPVISMKTKNKAHAKAQEL